MIVIIVTVRIVWPTVCWAQPTKQLQVWQSTEQGNPTLVQQRATDREPITLHYVHLMQTPIREASGFQGFAELLSNDYFPGSG